jgi:thiol-disulfide isomerase/thioredoxin
MPAAIFKSGIPLLAVSPIQKCLVRAIGLAPYASSNDLDKFITTENAKPAPEIAVGDWINSEPLKLDGLRGRVVMVDFWTFGCHNCRSTLPTVKRLDAELRGKGLTIVGVHTPESDYERVLSGLRSAVEKLGIKYPIVTDVDHKTWDAYGIEARPTVNVLDKQDRIRYTHIGEGAFETQEQVIRSLLSENR